MSDTNNIFPPDASAVFALMKSFTEQQLTTPPISVDVRESGEREEEMRHRFLAAAMSMLSASSAIHTSAWPPESQITMPTSKAEFEASLDELNLSSQIFSGLVTPSPEATISPPGDFPLLNPFMIIPPGLQSAGTKGLLPLFNGNKDDDFCNLCQKHFCNKYYLRKHKSDVHRILSEPISQMRKRDAGFDESPDENNSAEKSQYTSTNDWMNIPTLSAAPTPQVVESQSSRRTPVEGFRGVVKWGEANAMFDREQVSLWNLKPEIKSSRLEVGENVTYIPSSVAFEPVTSPSLSTSAPCKTLNSGAFDMFKSSMAAAKLADRVTCELCKKELCNKYFLRTHKIKVHGLSPQDVGGPISRSLAGKNTDKTQTENTSQGVEAFSPPPPLPPPLSLMTPMLPSQFPAPLGSLLQWLPPQPPFTMPDLPKPPQEEVGKDPVLQLMAANALVTCPLCNKTIGPRLFLPAHLTSAHSLNPTDPSFFIFILSARSLNANGDSGPSVTKTTPPCGSGRGSPTSTTIQLPNTSLLRLPFTTSDKTISREQSGVSQLSVQNPMNGILPPPISINDVGTGGSAFDLSVMATASNAPLLFPPPLGLLPTPPTIQPPPPPPATSAAGMMVNPTAEAASTTKWNPVHMATSGLAIKRVLLNGSTNTPPRKSPNQMRVLCDICNKWICNKYFLRTHKANKHGMADQSAVMPSTSQAMGSATNGIGAVPLDFSKPGKRQYQPQNPPSGMSEGTPEFFPIGMATGNEGSSTVHPPILTSWLFTDHSPHSPHPRNPNVPPLSTEPVQTNPTERQDSCGYPLNLSLKLSPQPPPSASLKHRQFLSDVPRTALRRRHLKIRRRHLQLHKRATKVLVRAHRHLSAFQGISLLLKGNTKPIPPIQDEIRMDKIWKKELRPWQNVYQVGNVCFDKRSQLEAHCYTTNHQGVPRINLPTLTNPFHPSTGSYNHSVDSVPHNSTAQIRSDSSMDEADGWWTRQHNWPISFAQSKLTSHQSSSGNSITAEQFCSYQASYHII